MITQNNTPQKDLMPRTQGDVEAELASDAVSQEEFNRVGSPDTGIIKANDHDTALLKHVEHVEADREILDTADTRRQALGQKVARGVIPAAHAIDNASVGFGFNSSQGVRERHQKERRQEQLLP